MHTTSFKRFLRKLATLSKRQRIALMAALRPAIGMDRVAGVLEQAAAATRACPSCSSARIYRHGHAHGLQRYRCRACGKTFNDLTGTPLARLRLKERWLDYLDTVLDSRTVRRAADLVSVHRNTSFRWRHRFLDLARHDGRGTLGGIAEADEMYVLESEKGSRHLARPARKRGGAATKRGISGEQVCVLVARDRNGRTQDFVTGKGPVTKRQLHRDLLPVLARDVLLVSDANAAYRYFAREAGITHEWVNPSAGQRVRGAIHVQNVNAYHSRLRSWLTRFHGVATRYLPNYLGWRWALDLNRVSTPEHLLRTAIGIFHTQR